MKSETLGLHLGIGIFKNPSGDTNMLPEWTTAFLEKIPSVLQELLFHNNSSVRSQTESSFGM